jgi:hypothetical protein
LENIDCDEELYVVVLFRVVLVNICFKYKLFYI